MLITHFGYFNNWQLNAKSKVPLHDHNIYELVFFCEGRGESHTFKNHFLYEPNTCILYAPLTVHDEYHQTPTKTVCIGFTLDKEIFPTIQIKENTEQLFLLKDKIAEELQNKKHNYPDMIDSIVKEIVVIISRMHNATEISQSEYYCLDSAITFINENFYSELNFKEIANTYGYSYDYFRHLFKNKFGISPHQYIIQIRLQRAKELLIQTNDSVQNIALKCGFENLSKFSYIFKKHFSAPPTLYREKQKKVKNGCNDTGITE